MEKKSEGDEIPPPAAPNMAAAVQTTTLVLVLSTLLKNEGVHCSVGKTGA